MVHLILVFCLMAMNLWAQDSLEVIEVTKARNSSFSEFWEENRGTQIFSGKKNTITSLKEIPQLQSNNYRQATSQTPGLLISEVPNESLAAITYRGLGDPHESYNLLLLQDGIPVAADMYGYPAHYYSPALPMVEKVQFTRGGASLLYGPQPGGVLNYYSRPLIRTDDDKASAKVALTAGSYNFLSTNNSIYGQTEKSLYAVEYHRRQGQGVQQENADFYADYLQARQRIELGSNHLKLSFNGYNSDHGNPGGFSKSNGTGENPFGENQRKATRKHDRLKVSRAQFLIGHEARLNETSRLETNLWASAYRRYSKAQDGGGFGTFPTGNTNTIVTQNYYGFNGEVRYLKNYGEHTFSGGFLTYNLLSPYVSEVGARPDANHGEVNRRLERKTKTQSIFLENRFSFGNFMLTPGIRIESIRQEITERKNLINGAKRDEDKTTNVPLLGLGMAYHVNETAQIYGNISESYKPVTYQEAVPLINSSQSISEDIDPSKILSYELGYRLQNSKLVFDTSLFFIRYENKFGVVGSNYQNTGAGQSRGIDSAFELKLSEFFSTLKTVGDLNLYANLEILDARFTHSDQAAAVNLKNKTPQYAPKTISRFGVILNRENESKTALMGVNVASHYGDDANSDQFYIPSFTVFDLTHEMSLSQKFQLQLGINNLLDKNYFSRVRADGIQWAMGRNYYLGLSYNL